MLRLDERASTPYAGTPFQTCIPHMLLLQLVAAAPLYWLVRELISNLCPSPDAATASCYTSDWSTRCMLPLGDESSSVFPHNPLLRLLLLLRCLFPPTFIFSLLSHLQVMTKVHAILFAAPVEESHQTLVGTQVCT